MRRCVAALVAFLALAAPGVAFAHATLKQENPGYRERLATGPAAVVLRFDQEVTAFPDSVVVRDARGVIVSDVAASGADTRVVLAPLRKLAKGAYTVRWHVLASDGHAVSGVYTFGVRVAAPPPTEAYGSSGPTKAEDVVRWAYFLSLSLVVGGLGFALVVLRGVPPALAQRLYQLIGLGVVATLEVGIVGFILRAEGALQLPFGRLLYADLSPIAAGTRLGSAFTAMTMGFVAVSVFVYLAWLLDRVVLLWPAFVLALAFASGLSLSGHQAADKGSSRVTEFADWVHLSSALLWVGGLAVLAVCVWPLAPALRREVFVRFSRLATLLIAALLGAGIYLSVVRLPAVSDLWTAGYGRVLLVKIGLVSVALLWGAFHHFVARPALVREGPSAWPARLGKTLLGEASVAMAILLLAAILVDSKPPT
ncbi:MAG TPA: copper resistance protein CopC [Gaiellaceae bacterium]|jgi:copper transport protein|nr:copper resistance protein CopC [Gaiellaceae bacterium]